MLAVPSKCRGSMAAHSARTSNIAAPLMVVLLLAAAATLISSVVASAPAPAPAPARGLGRAGNGSCVGQRHAGACYQCHTLPCVLVRSVDHVANADICCAACVREGRFAAFAISSLSIGRLPPDFTSSLVTTSTVATQPLCQFWRSSGQFY